MTFSTFSSPGVSLQGGSGSGSGGTPGGATTQIQYNNAGAFAGASGLTTNGTNLTFGSASQLLWSTDLILTRRGAANLRFGAVDAAAPVAQTLSVQSVVAGTSNTAGANLTITGSQGTGTGAGGSIVFQVAPAGSTGTAQNALVDALTISSARNLAVGGASIQFGAVGSGTRLLTSGKALVVDSGNTNDFGSVTASSYILNSDVILARDAANTLALRNGGTSGTPVPQTFRVYNWGNTTDGEYTEINWFSNICYFQVTKAGTSTFRDLDIRANAINFSSGTSLTQRWQINTSGHFLTGTDNTYDIGAATATRPRNLFLGSYAQLSEMTAPAAPATNDVRIYAEDNGAGKTRLMARFATGAAVQIAIEP